MRFKYMFLCAVLSLYPGNVCAQDGVKGNVRSSPSRADDRILVDRQCYQKPPSTSCILPSGQNGVCDGRDECVENK